MIRVSDLVQHYGVRPVLNGVSFDVNRGEIIAIMGPNGMGKSTLLSAIAGILTPQSGYVEIDGNCRRRTEREETAARKMVVFLPDQSFIPPQRTGREWVLAVGRLYDVPDARLIEHSEQLFKIFDMQPLADSPVSSYSTGQKKKIGLCSALITETPVLLLDEPFSGGLDPSGLLTLKTLLLHLAKKKERTIILATPVPELVEEVADRILILREGKVAAYDTAQALRAQSGTTGSLGEVYEHLTNPRTLDNLREYLDDK
jgi:ABC-type multidrug transport system ATPase subunit